MKPLRSTLRDYLLRRLVRGAPLTAAASLAEKLGEMEGNAAHAVFYQQGFHLLRKHFYLPLPDEADMGAGFWDERTELIGVDMNDRQGLDFLEHLFPPRVQEFREKFPIEATGEASSFFLMNGGYMAVDAHVYYALIRHFKPRRIIEIGIGNSTLLAGAACVENQRETGRATSLVAIDPFPWDLHKRGFPGLSELIPKRVQDVDVSFFASLAENDILFIDSSHVLREGNDVQFEYLEILPRLAPGVLVHVHDISLPRRYPRVYFQNQLYWNEQYLLQAFLAFNPRFEVIWAGNYMMLKYPEKVCGVFPEFQLMRQRYPASEPSAFWMRVKR